MSTAFFTQWLWASSLQRFFSCSNAASLLRSTRMDTWILVADASRARIFAAGASGQPWKLVEDFEHPES
ncbi:MAG: host attachment protein, partial [Pirellulales bacterium]